jgi:hypothetical protein
MSELKLPEASPSWDSVVYVIALIVAAAGVLVALVKGWEAWKKISVRDKVKDLEGRMSKVEARLKLGDKRFSLQNDDMGHLLQIQMTLMMHFVSGNDHDKLKAQITALGDYMAQRATKAAAYAAEHERITNGGDENV